MDVPLYALLVGIDRYPHPSLGTLDGAVNDVVAVRTLLVDRLGVPADHVVTLTDELATRADIEATFRSHLHGHGERWRRDGTGPPPAFLFHFSGHGSQAPDALGGRTDGLSETIVPYDGREDEVYDIKDFELGAWLAELPGDNVTVVLDCCHSGSGIAHPGLRPHPPSDPTTPPTDREPGEGDRSAPADERPQPVPRPGPRARELGFHPTPSSGNVLLAACRDHESAFEHRRPDGTVHGLLTLALLDQLASLGEGPTATYRDLHQQLRFEVLDRRSRRRRQQTPLCEGDLDRELFSGRHRTPPPDLVGHVIGVRRDRVWIGAGTVHGITRGSRLELDGPDEVVTIEVEGVEPVRCNGRVLDRGGDPDGAPTPVPPRGTAARLAHLDLGARRWRIVADGPDRDAVAAATGSGRSAGLVAWTDRPDEADLRIRPCAGGRELVDTVGRRLVHADTIETLLDAAAHVARVAWLRTLERPDLGPDLPGEIRVSAGNGVVAGDRLVVEITNGTPVPLYAGLIAFTDAWEVTVLHPVVRGAEDRLAPDHHVRVEVGTDPSGAARPAGCTGAVSALRAVVTTHPTPFEALGLRPPPADWSLAPSEVLAPAALRQQSTPSEVLSPRRPGWLPSRWATATVHVATGGP